MSKNHSKKCPHCDGAGETVIPYASAITQGKYRKCYTCDGSGTNPVRWTSDYENARYLSNNDNESEPMCISNIRVWREEAEESENKLWRYCTGHYGSKWIELDKRLDAPVAHLKAISKKAWNLGFDSVSSVADMLIKLDSYPILDEDDEGQAEMEEQTEHWENYGKEEFRQLVEELLDATTEMCPLNNWEMFHGHYTLSDLHMLDVLYADLCTTAGFWPERIDSSAWNFGLDEDRRGRGQIRELLEREPWLVYPVNGPQTLHDFIIDHQAQELEPEVLVCIDVALSRGELDTHIAGELLKLGQPTSTGELP